ncbi:MAG TPA: DUF6010 family protein [Candidatus Polarisedimenticolia bacterium]|nr:DUF6010 family protein [Candidatus Polarisedimenticolia bacterium]
MALSAIVAWYIGIGLLAAAGAVTLSSKLLSAKGEQIFFGLFLVPIAGMYLTFTTYFASTDAWRLETVAVVVFAVLGVLGSRVAFLLVLGYALHGGWDLLHESCAHTGVCFGTRSWSEIPLAYGFFCATFDWCMAGYFFTRRRQWSAAWRGQAR